MYDMDVNEIKQLIKKSKMENGMTKDEATLNYYDELSLLLEDIEYFTLYLKRHKTSKFNFDIKVNYGSSSKSFMDIWKLYEYRKDRESIDATFAKFSLLQAIIEDLANDTYVYGTHEIQRFILNFESEDGLKIEDYVSDFVNSNSASKVKNKIDAIKHEPVLDPELAKTVRAIMQEQNI